MQSNQNPNNGAKPVNEFAENRDEIKGKIAAAAKEAGRNPDDITLVAVSKTQPYEKLQAAINAGQRIFGENRVQEAYYHWGDCSVYGIDRNDLELRLIGPLQTNKSDEAVKLFDVIETLDREHMCSALRKSIDKIGRHPQLLIQVNIGDEAQKAGVAIDELPQLLETAREKYGLKVDGLMCIPPNGLPAAPFFALLHKMANEQGLKILSMGMSSDYEVAVKFGATHVRVGTALFGARNYQ